MLGERRLAQAHKRLHDGGVRPLTGDATLRPGRTIHTRVARSSTDILAISKLADANITHKP